MVFKAYLKYSHQYWMKEALVISQSLKQNEVPVCTLIVKDNLLISKAVNVVENTFDSTAHAEIVSIREASRSLSNWRLNECTLYTTLEPCSMCMGAIINSRISKVVFGAYDLSSGACGSVLDLASSLSKENKIEIIGGILELECSKLLKNFFLLRR